MLFRSVRPGKGQKRPIGSMPGHFQWSVDTVVGPAKEAAKLGVPSVILFGIPEKKDAKASGAYAKNGIVQQAVKAVKDMQMETAWEYLGAKSMALRAADPEKTRERGMREFLDNKTYRPGLQPVKRG